MNVRGTTWEGQMNKALLVLVAAAISLSAGPAMAQKKQLVIVVKGLDNPFFEAIQSRLREVEQGKRQFPLSLLLHGACLNLGRGGRGPDRPGHAWQARHRGDCDLAFERAIDRQRDQGRQTKNSRHDARRRPQKRRRSTAQDLSRHRQLPDGLSARRIFEEGKAERRHSLPDRRAMPPQTTFCVAPPERAMPCPARRIWTR